METAHSAKNILPKFELRGTQLGQRTPKTQTGAHRSAPKTKSGSEESNQLQVNQFNEVKPFSLTVWYVLLQVQRTETPEARVQNEHNQLQVSWDLMLPPGQAEQKSNALKVSVIAQSQMHN